MFLVSTILDLMLYLTKNQSAVVIATCTVSRKGLDGLTKILRTSSARKNIVHISKGNSIPWLKGKIWIVVKGLIKLRAATFDGKKLIEIALSKDTRAYAKVTAIDAAFKILQQGITDKENKAELNALRTAIEGLEGNRAPDVIYVESE